MTRSVAASAGEGVDIAGDVAVAVPTGSACRVVWLLLLYLSDRPTSDSFREVVWLAMLTAQPWQAERPLHLFAECTVGGGTCEGSAARIGC